MGVSKKSISKFLIGNRFHVKLRILSPENCKQSLRVKSWKATSNRRNNQLRWQPVTGGAGDGQSRTPAAFTEGPSWMLYRGRQNIFGILPKFLEKLLQNENLVCSATVETKIALGVLQLWLNYFTTSLFKALCYTLF